MRQVDKRTQIEGIEAEPAKMREEETFQQRARAEEQGAGQQRTISEEQGAGQYQTSGKQTANRQQETPEEQEARRQKEEKQDERIGELGQVTLDGNEKQFRIHLLNIIGEVEGHENAASSQKTTKYEHVLPQLAMIEDSEEIDGILILLNTVGGDVEAGLAIAEMIASLSKPTVSLVLGGGHSIGVPLAVSSDYSFIVPSATMMIHPVRSSGMFIGVLQSYRNIEKIQDRITEFVSSHSKMSQKRIEELMLDTTQLVKDVGTMLNGKEAVEEGLINEIGGIKDAMQKLYSMIEENRKEQQ